MYFPFNSIIQGLRQKKQKKQNYSVNTHFRGHFFHLNNKKNKFPFISSQKWLKKPETKNLLNKYKSMLENVLNPYPNKPNQIPKSKNERFLRKYNFWKPKKNIILTRIIYPSRPSFSSLPWWPWLKPNCFTPVSTVGVLAVLACTTLALAMAIRDCTALASTIHTALPPAITSAKGVKFEIVALFPKRENFCCKFFYLL